MTFPNTIKNWRKALRGDAAVETAVLAGIVLLALVCRLVYLRQFSQSPICAAAVGPDVKEYDAWARDILGGRLLWTRLHIHAPLYPYLLALLYAVTRVDLVLVRAVQLCMDVGSLLLTYAAVRLLWNRRRAVALGLMWAVYLPLIYFSAELVSETLVVFLLSAALFFWALAARRRGVGARPRLACHGLTGLCLGLAATAHPLSLLFSVGFLPLAAWIRWREDGLAAARASALFMLLATAVPIAAVAGRNIAVSGELVLIQAHQGLNFYIGNHAEATGTCSVRPGPEYERLVDWPEKEGIEGERGAKRFYHRQAWAFIAERPLKWIALLARKALLTWNAQELPSGSDLPELQVAAPFMRLPLLRFGVVAPLALVGIWLSRGRREAYPHVLLIGAYSAALTVFVTSGRYRLGMIPGVLVMAAAAVDQLILAWRADDFRRWLAASALMAVGMGVAFGPLAPSLPGSGAETAQLMAEAAWRTQQTGAAERWLRLGLRLDPDNASMRHLLGVVLADTGRAEEALSTYCQALALRPDNVRVRVDYAIALSGLGRKSEAEQELSRALAIDPSSASVLYNRGVLAERESRSAAAEADYRRAAELDPSFASARLNYAILLHRKAAYDEAREHYEAALRLQPTKVKALTGLALLSADTGRPREARKRFERSLSLDPGQARVWIAYGRFLDSLGHREQAAEALRKGEAQRRRDTEQEGRPVMDD